MERMTTRSNDGTVSLSARAWSAALERLAAYEDICFDSDGKEIIPIDRCGAKMDAKPQKEAAP